MHPVPAPADLQSPSQMVEALTLLAQGAWQPLAGGTDVFPSLVGKSLSRPLVNLTAIPALRGMSRVSVNGGSFWRIGASETWAALRETRLPAGLEALSQAAAEIGGRQVQNQGTLGGNLCNASPAADGVPVLLALDAQVELQSLRGSRRLAVADFVLGNRRTAIAADELLVAIDIPLGSHRARSSFLKLGHRRFLVISIAMVAVAVDCDAAGRLVRCAIAVGSCSAAARRLATLESLLVGLAAEEAPAQAARALSSDCENLLAPLSPIDDVRGTARYRRDAARELIPRAMALSVADVSRSLTPSSGERS